MHLRPFNLDPADGRITREDHAIITPWWEARGGQAPGRCMFPTLGFIASGRCKTPLATASAYLDATGSGVAQIAYAATNPEASKILRARALIAILDFLIPHIHSLGYWLINASFHHPDILRLLKRRRFTTAETGMENLYLNLHTHPWDLAQSV